MIDKIENIEEVSTYFIELFNEGVCAHPDDDFRDYINYETKEASYSMEEAILRNMLMNQSFKVCDKHGVDIYDLIFKVYNSKKVWEF